MCIRDRCGNDCENVDNLNQHSKLHPEEVNSEMPVLSNLKSRTQQCNICEKQFKHGYTLKRHERESHGAGAVSYTHLYI